MLIAMLRAGTVLNVAHWDGVAEWDPVGAGLCDATVECTAQPLVEKGWTYASGTFTPGPPPDPIPDPTGFGNAIFVDASIPIATRLQLMPWIPVLTTQIGNVALITLGWSELVAALAISADTQSTIHAYALQYAIPGI
jgi:hypothetical protein